MSGPLRWPIVPPIGFAIGSRLRPRQSSRPPCASIAMSSRSLILTSPFSYLHLDYDHTINCQAPSRAERDRKSTRLNPVTNAHLVCSLLLEKKNLLAQQLAHAA